MVWWASPVEASSFSRLTKKRSARPRSAIAVQRKESRPDLALEKGADWSFFVAMMAKFFSEAFRKDLPVPVHIVLPVLANPLSPGKAAGEGYMCF